MPFFKQRYFLGLLLFLAFLVAGYFIWQDSFPRKTEEVSDVTGGLKPEIKTEEGIGVKLGGDISSAIIEKIELKIPDLDRPIEVSLDLDGDELQKMILEIQQLSNSLKRDYDFVDEWLQLGILRKTIGDYEGALEAWNFAGVIRPNAATSFLNSADLYAFYIKDRKKAEESFLKAIKAEPSGGFAYFQTAGFYRDVLKDLVKARNILEQGISAGADSTGDLQGLLNSL
ncbi:MAG: hypothetical protein HYW09_00790 [Candidatus Niyogibacteria bacterium]|nr:hypothetical protein [Candidatus Niyogibacteria bacterium]